MKSIKWSFLATAALASLVLSVAMQQQNVEAANEDKSLRNHHDHSTFSEKHGIRGNDGTVVNEEDSHFNSIDNTNKEGDTPDERSNCNSHTIPAKGGEEGNIPCPP